MASCREFGARWRTDLFVQLSLEGLVVWGWTSTGSTASAAGSHAGDPTPCPRTRSRARQVLGRGISPWPSAAPATSLCVATAALRHKDFFAPCQERKSRVESLLRRLARPGVQNFLRTYGFQVPDGKDNLYRKALGFSTRVPRHPTRIRQMLDSRLKQLKATGPVLVATLSQVNKRCGQPSCACHHGGSLAPGPSPDPARTWQDPHRLCAPGSGRRGPPMDSRAQTPENDPVREVSQLTLALIRGHVPHRERRRGRH